MSWEGTKRAGGARPAPETIFDISVVLLLGYVLDAVCVGLFRYFGVTFLKRLSDTIL